MNEKKIKNWVMVRPRKGKEWCILILMVISIMLTISPAINLWNVPVLVLGMPLMLLVSLLTLVAVLVIINIAYRWGVK